MNYYLFLSILSIFVLLSCYLTIGKNKNEINIICSAIFTILFTLTVFYLVETPIIEGNTIKIKMEGGDKIESIAKSIFKPDNTEDVRINVVNNHRGMAIPKPIVSEYTQLNTDELTNEDDDETEALKLPNNPKYGCYRHVEGGCKPDNKTKWTDGENKTFAANRYVYDSWGTKRAIKKSITIDEAYCVKRGDSKAKGCNVDRSLVTTKFVPQNSRRKNSSER